MPLGIDPKVDFTFKMVFGNPGHTDITIRFLNSVLSPLHPIEWVEILNPIQGKDRSEDKLVVLDVLASVRRQLEVPESPFRGTLSQHSFAQEACDAQGYSGQRNVHVAAGWMPRGEDSKEARNE